MSDDLSQFEADRLFKMTKKRKEVALIQWPALGKKIAVDLVSTDDKEAFILDVGRNYVNLTRLILQNRAKVTVILVRLDIDGSPHTNPDGEEFGCPHIHLYREGYNDKWAYPVPVQHFTNLTDRKQIIADFMSYCSIVDPPEFRGDLFS